MFRPKNSLLSLLSLSSLPFLGVNSATPTCASLAHSFKFENTTVTGAELVNPLTNFTVFGVGGCQTSALSGNITVCRVQLTTNTTSTSAVRMEAWLPNPSDWQGRFVGLGNGGLGGCIDYSNLAYTTSFNFASIGSNNGHDGNSGSVFLNKPEVINDFAFRAVHTEVLVGKALVKAYYGKTQKKSYYLGCSTGGRQALKTADMFPEDFDGMLGGAPAQDFNHLIGWSALLSIYGGAPAGNTSAKFIPPATWPLISQEILRQCDGLDGLMDGIITEPDQCVFRPEALVCPQGTKNTTGCLTAAQIATLHQIYEPIFGTKGELLYPRYDPGAEDAGSFAIFFNGQIFSFSSDWYKFAVFNDTNHSFENFTVNDLEFTDTINPGGISTWTGDLSAYKNRGGKFITYHGRRDQLIASGNSKRRYDFVSATMGLNPSQMDTFYRLFLIPGMGHCSGGQGAFEIGQVGGSSFTNDPSGNLFAALIDWVENGREPNTVVGFNPTTGQERLHCRYPMRSVLSGTTFTCVS